jgi:3',5'-nucleoside bisphosphate phosphatase
VHLLNADLHSHSIHSDGTLTPSQVAARAAANGVQLWALTDHDDLGGQHEAAQAARSLGIDFVHGVEISTTFAGETVHIVGLGIDPQDATLRAGLQGIRDGRTDRARRMAEGLAQVGIRGALEGAQRLARNPELISRTHFARFLVDTGVCASVHEVFRRYLSEGKPGNVPHEWTSVRDAVQWIRTAGGIAVIVHPARYRLSANAEWALFHDFKGHGGGAVEVVCASHTAAEVEKYADYAREFDLLASRGSDFHDPQESRADLGRVGDLPGRVTPVWEALQPRVKRAYAAQALVAG